MNLLDENKMIDLAELFKIFGDSTRIKIINVLLDNELCVGENKYKSISSISSTKNIKII